MVVFGQSGSISSKSGCNRAKVVVFGQYGFFRKSSCDRAKRFFWAKVVVFGQSGCIRENKAVFGQTWLYSGKVDSFRYNFLYWEKSGYVRRKVDEFGQKWLYSGKVVLFLAKVVVFGQKLLY